MEPVVTPRTFQNRYEVTHLIARGGMAQVYRALDTRLGRHVAVKVLFPELSIDRTFVERFRREAQAAAHLSHPNVVAVYDWGEDEGTYFLVMELVEGTSLATALRAEKSMPATRAATIAAQVAGALAYAHRHGVVHRDIKPGNVLLTDDGQVKVTDFGIAQAISTEEGLTMAGSVMGTAAYFSPEQAEGAVVDGRSDVYSLGVVLFEMLAGRPPFVGDSPVAVASMHVRNDPPPLRELNPAVPEAIELVTMRALQKRPDQRYQTAEDFRADLLRFCEGRPVLATPVSAGIATTGVLGEVGAVTTVLPSAQGSTTVLPAAVGTTGTMPARDTTTAVPAVAPLAALPVTAPPVAPSPFLGDGAGVPPARPARPNRTPWVIAALLVALAIAGFFVARALAGPTVLRMPDLVGHAYAPAAAQLRGEGFTVNEHQVHNQDPQGTIVQTHPPKGTSLRSGQSILLVVSLGPPHYVNVPTVTGDNLVTAEQALTSADLRSQLVKVAQWNAPVVPDSVLAQSVAGGTQVQSGDVITLTVLAANGQYPVPNLTNDSGPQAGSTLNQYGLTTGTASQQCSSSVANGNVISTSPPANQMVQAGTPVNLVLSTGACPVQVPNLYNLNEQQATQAAQAVQLTVSFTQMSCSAGEVSSGLVVQQSPAALSMAQPDTPINATIGCTTSSTTTTSFGLRGHGHGHGR